MLSEVVSAQTKQERGERGSRRGTEAEKVTMKQRGETKTPSRRWKIGLTPVCLALTLSHFSPLVVPFSSGSLNRFDAFHLVPLNDAGCFLLLTVQSSSVCDLTPEL